MLDETVLQTGLLGMIENRCEIDQPVTDVGHLTRRIHVLDVPKGESAGESFEVFHWVPAGRLLVQYRPSSKSTSSGSVHARAGTVVRDSRPSVSSNSARA